MSEELSFRFSIARSPEGPALTGSEIEQALLKSLAASNGSCQESLWSLATLYQAAGRLDEATACVQRVVDLAGDLEKVGAGLLGLGQLEESRGDYSAAAKRYREALLLEPCSTQTWYFIHNNLGYALNQLGDHASAIPYLERACVIDGGRPNAYKNLGLAHQALGDVEKAAVLFVKATQANAADSRSLDHLMALLEAHPALEIDVPDLRFQIEACKQAVNLAKERQPDFQSQWAHLRECKKRKWWQFWKR